MDDNEVFKALSDPTRRTLLDRLWKRNGQTLGQLCDALDWDQHDPDLTVLEKEPEG